MKESKNNRKFTGVVVSDKSDKTVVVAVKNVQIHPLYKKRYATTKHYKVHDEKNEYRIDDEIIFVECRPLSKEKRWRAIKA
ncbi:MAG: 30S ribosomal protein S17 [Patescibacteria group bacterium]|nr:30S ribosomal protein S17 [Patescibacteria group bacterium]